VVFAIRQTHTSIGECHLVTWNARLVHIGENRIARIVRIGL